MTTASKPMTEYRSWAVEEFRAETEPYYVAVSDEIDLFRAAWEAKIPVLLKGPTGCGKTRFVEHMAYHLNRPVADEDGNISLEDNLPLVTVACHEDLTASDLVGRYLLEGQETVWIDGPLTRAVKAGAICYLDEVVEARKDTTVLIHPLTDHRRILPIEKKSQLLQARDGFLMVISFNPGYQSALKDLKQSTRQRFISIEFDYPPRDTEAEIVAHEAEQKRLPILYRVHEPPPTDKMLELQTLLGRLSYRVSRGKISQKDLQAVLKQVGGRPEEKLVSTVILRSMSRARYDTRNLGHYGLASDWYTHFTSPIRRYPDLWLHRVLVHALVEGRAVPEDWKGEGLKEKAQRCSVRERVAEVAERESVDLKKVEYMERYLGDEFSGTVSGVTSFGIFVLLDDVFVDGLVHVNSMTDDYYIFHQDRYMLVGERSHRTFRLGDRLVIKVARVDKEELLIDFTIVGSEKTSRKAR